MDWFTVDKNGLAKILERKGKEFMVFELAQNAWDEKTTRVEIKLERVAHSPFVSLTVRDDNPEGFADLSHAFTLFAESAKKGDPEKRGRFNLGEKLVLAMCAQAQISSTKGTIIFDGSGRRKSSEKTASGSEFWGTFRMTDKEMAEVGKAVDRLLPPLGIETFFNGRKIETDKPSYTFSNTLPTEISDVEGNLRRANRKTEINVYDAHGWGAMLYEMGIPVVEIEGRWHINVTQKVPLNLDRDNVHPSYIARLHALVVEQAHNALTVDDVNEAWVREAVQTNAAELSDATITMIADLRFGKNRVSYDPSDPEANNIAITKGYQVVHGGAMAGSEWDAMRRAGAILPAGKVTPSRPDTTVPRITIPQNKWTPAMHALATYCKALAPTLIGVDNLIVQFFNNPTVGEIATYGHRTISFNVGRLGYNWFLSPLEKINELIIHEFAHEVEGNHLSEAYYDALTVIGAKMSVMALRRPYLFHNFDAERQVTTEASHASGR